MNPDVLKPVVLSSEYEAPQGLVSIDADNGHTSLWTRVGRVNAMGQFDVVRESMLPVRPDPYLVSH